MRMAAFALALTLAGTGACSRSQDDGASQSTPKTSAATAAAPTASDPYPEGDYDPDPKGPHFPCGPKKRCHYDTTCVITQAAEPIAICTMSPKVKGCAKTGDRVYVCPHDKK
jgi:hypothetical protein